jgi:hypothetical protein
MAGRHQNFSDMPMFAPVRLAAASPARPHELLTCGLCACAQLVVRLMKQAGTRSPFDFLHTQNDFAFAFLQRHLELQLADPALAASHAAVLELGALTQQGAQDAAFGYTVRWEARDAR